MMKAFKIIIPILSVLLLSSCVGEEPNDIGYVTAMGIDEGENGFKYTIQFANPTKISGGASEEGGSGGDIVENITVEAPTTYSAISHANSIISKDLSLSHAKLIVVSEKLAEKGLDEIFDVIARNNDIRPDIYLAVADDAGKYLEGVKPVVELNPVKYYQLTYENKKGGSVPQNNASEFYMAYSSMDRDCVLPLAGVAGIKEQEEDTDAGSGGSSGKEEPSENKKNKDAKEIESEFQKGSKNYFPGQAGVQIKNKSETMGLAIFNGDKYVGKLGAGDAYIYNILMNEVKNSKATFYDKNSLDIPITMSLEEKRAPHYSIDREKKIVHIDLKLEAEILSVPQKHNSDKKMDNEFGRMVSDATEEFLKRTYSEKNSDVIGIRGKLKRFYVSNKEYNKYIETFSANEWSFDVNTDLVIKRTGMTYYY